MYTSTVLSKRKCIEHGFFGRGDNGKYEVINQSVLLNQVHEDRSIVINQYTKKQHTADASITNAFGVSLAIKTADCVPIMMFNQTTNTIAAVHAGWRGTLDNIAAKTLKKLAASRKERSNTIVALGPSIGPCCYSVVGKRADRFFKAYGKDSGVVSYAHDTYFLNLMWANVINLLNCGIAKKNIDIPLFCTKCQSEKFHSFRAGDVLDSIQEHNISFIKLLK